MANGRIPQPGMTGQALVNPVAPVGMGMPQEKTGPIRNFLQNLQANPQLQQALMATGLGLLGDQRPGETGFGQFSRAALGGMQQFQQAKAMQEAQRREQEELALQQQLADSLVEHRAGTRDLQAEGIEVDREGIEARKDIAEKDIQARIDTAKIRAQGEIEGAQVRGAAASTGQERIIESTVKALMDPEGLAMPEAQARLVATGVLPTADPAARQRASTTVFKTLADINKSNEMLNPEKALTFQELVDKTNEVVDSFSGGLDLGTGAGRGGIPNVNVGDKFVGPRGVNVTVESIGDGRVTFVTEDGSTFTGPAAQFAQRYTKAE